MRAEGNEEDWQRGLPSHFFSGHKIRVKKIKAWKKSKSFLEGLAVGMFTMLQGWWGLGKKIFWKIFTKSNLHGMLYMFNVLRNLSFYMNLVRILSFFRDSSHLKASTGVNVRVGFSFGLLHCWQLFNLGLTRSSSWEEQWPTFSCAVSAGPAAVGSCGGDSCWRTAIVKASREVFQSFPWEVQICPFSRILLLLGRAVFLMEGNFLPVKGTKTINLFMLFL